MLLYTEPIFQETISLPFIAYYKTDPTKGKVEMTKFASEAFLHPANEIGSNAGKPWVATSNTSGSPVAIYEKVSIPYSTLLSFWHSSGHINKPQDSSHAVYVENLFRAFHFSEEKGKLRKHRLGLRPLDELHGSSFGKGIDYESFMGQF